MIVQFINTYNMHTNLKYEAMRESVHKVQKNKKIKK